MPPEVLLVAELMETGELNLQNPVVTPDPASATGEPVAKELPTLPDKLQNMGKLLQEALAKDREVAQSFSTFCNAAYAKPEWAVPASDFLAELFADKEDMLAELARIPDLVIEMATGSVTLTCVVAGRWAARGYVPRLARLAESVVAAQSKMSGPAVVEVMLALATSLAVSRCTRAEQLLAAAQPHIGPEHKELQAEAQLWLAAGQLIRGCRQEARDLWDKRLRRPKHPWTWESENERAALLQLSECLDKDAPGVELFRAVVPPSWWDLVTLTQPVPQEPSKAAEPTPPKPVAPELARFTQDVEYDNLPGVRSSALTFLMGSALGATTMAIIFWVLRPGPPAALPLDPNAASFAALGSAPGTEWRVLETALLARDTPDLLPVAGATKAGTWAQHQALLEGSTAELPKGSLNHLKLLLWLHLDPPQDREMRAKVPVLLADLRQDQSVLDLWQRLIYPGSPNAEEVRNAAKLQIHSNAGAWTPAQQTALMHIAGWNVASRENELRQ